MFLFSFDIYLFVKSLFISIVTHAYLFPIWAMVQYYFISLVFQTISAFLFRSVFNWILCPFEMYGFGRQVNFVPLSVVFALLLSSTKNKAKQNKATHLFHLITHQISENISLYTFSSLLQTKHSPPIPSTFLP